MFSAPVNALVTEELIDLNNSLQKRSAGAAAPLQDAQPYGEQLQDLRAKLAGLDAAVKQQ